MRRTALLLIAYLLACAGAALMLSLLGHVALALDGEPLPISVVVNSLLDPPVWLSIAAYASLPAAIAIIISEHTDNRSLLYCLAAAGSVALIMIAGLWWQYGPFPAVTDGSAFMIILASGVFAGLVYWVLVRLV